MILMIFKEIIKIIAKIKNKHKVKKLNRNFHILFLNNKIDFKFQYQKNHILTTIMKNFT